MWKSNYYYKFMHHFNQKLTQQIVTEFPIYLPHQEKDKIFILADLLYSLFEYESQSLPD